MKNGLLFCYLVLTTFAFNQTDSEIITKSFGIDYLRTTQIKLAMNKNKVAPYLSFNRRKSTFGFGISMGQKNIVEPFTIHDYSGNGNFTVDGGFMFYRVHPNFSNKRLNLYFEASAAYLISEARRSGQFTQNIHTVQSLLKIGYEIKLHKKLSLNFAGGVGMNINRGKNQFFSDSNEEEGWSISIIYFERQSLATAASIGLQYHF